MTGPWSIPKTNWPWPPPGHTTSGAVRTGEGHHEMPGLPYPAFRRVNAEPRGAASRPLRRQGRGQFQPLELDTVGVNLCKVVVRLLRKPGFSAASENLRQPHGHFG